MGEGEAVATERPFQSMKAVESTRAKLRSWVSSWRGWPRPRAESIVMIGERFLYREVYAVSRFQLQAVLHYLAIVVIVIMHTMRKRCKYVP